MSAFHCKLDFTCKNSKLLILKNCMKCFSPYSKGNNQLAGLTSIYTTKKKKISVFSSFETMKLDR